MALITIPTVSAKSLEMFLIRGDVPLEFFGGSEVIVQSTKAKYGVRFPLAVQNATDAEKRAWRSALVQLSKLSNTFQLTPPDWPGNGASYTGANPLVVGVQSGLSLDCDGASLSTAIALDGDYLEINNEFKTLTADATSDGAGLVTFNFEPAMRVATANNDPVDIKTPKLTLRLMESRADWFVSSPDIYDIPIQAIEAYPSV